MPLERRIPPTPPAARAKLSVVGGTARDIELLREVGRLSQDEGINLAGTKRITDPETMVYSLQARVGELTVALEGAAHALRQREAAVHASYRRDLGPYQAPT